MFFNCKLILLCIIKIVILKVVLLNEADHLSKDAQHALRRTMEKYSANLRLILCCDNTSKIISPIQSRCLLLRIAAPEEKDVKYNPPKKKKKNK